MKELEKINDLLNIEQNYVGRINKNDYIIVLGYAAYSTIRINCSNKTSREDNSLLGIDYRIIDSTDQYYITLIRKDLIHSLFRELHAAQHKLIDSIAYKGNNSYDSL